MTTISTMLTEYNDLRNACDLKPLKVWKSSKTKLQAKMDELTWPTANCKHMLASDDQTVNGTEISVADICRELNINPKVGRAKLRRRDMKSTDGRWANVLTGSTEHAELVKVLMNGRKEA